MARYLGTANLDRAQDEVFAYLADFSNVEEWDPSVTSAERIGGGAIRVGSRFSVELGFLGQPLALEYRILEIERPRRVVLEANTDSFRSLDTIVVSPHGAGGSRVSYDARIELKGMRALLDPALHAVFAFSGCAAVRGLRRAFDSPAPERGRRASATGRS